MEYAVLVEHVLPDDAGWYEDIEPGTTICPGDRLVDGDLEPDIMASLWSSGVIKPADDKAEAKRLSGDPERMIDKDTTEEE